MHANENDDHRLGFRPALAALSLIIAVAILASAPPKPVHGMTETSTLQVIAARDLVGRRVHDAAGARVGEARYVLIDVDLGVLLGVAVEPDDTSQGLLVVPWQSVDIVASDHGLVLSKRTSELSGAARLPRDRLAELTKPLLWESVTQYWLDVPAITDPRSAAGAKNGDASATSSKNAGRAKKTSRKAAEDEASKPRTQLLVGRTVVQILDGPEFRFADQVSGAEVSTSNDDTIGEIDEVVLDWEHGRVAYVVIAQGGFLGIGTRWLPVPLSALRWEPEAKRFVLTGSKSGLEQRKALDASRTPRRVRYADLAKLYGQWKATPYWQDDAPEPNR